MGQEHIRNIALLDNTSVSVICDPDQSMREESLAIAEQLGNSNITVVSTPAEVNLAALADALVIVSPNHTHHSLLKELLPLEIAEQRDPKGLYKKARSGDLKNFTGIDSPYEQPKSPEILVDTSSLSAEQCAEHVIRILRERGVITNAEV